MEVLAQKISGVLDYRWHFDNVPWQCGWWYVAKKSTRLSTARQLYYLRASVKSTIASEANHHHVSWVQIFDSKTTFSQPTLLQQGQFLQRELRRHMPQSPVPTWQIPWKSGRQHQADHPRRIRQHHLLLCKLSFQQSRLCCSWWTYSTSTVALVSWKVCIPPTLCLWAPRRSLTFLLCSTLGQCYLPCFAWVLLFFQTVVLSFRCIHLSLLDRLVSWVRAQHSLLPAIVPYFKASTWQQPFMAWVLFSLFLIFTAWHQMAENSSMAGLDRNEEGVVIWHCHHNVDPPVVNKLEIPSSNWWII